MVPDVLDDSVLGVDALNDDSWEPGDQNEENAETASAEAGGDTDVVDPFPGLGDGAGDEWEDGDHDIVNQGHAAVQQHTVVHEDINKHIIESLILKDGSDGTLYSLSGDLLHSQSASWARSQQVDALEQSEHNDVSNIDASSQNGETASDELGSGDGDSGINSSETNWFDKRVWVLEDVLDAWGEQLVIALHEHIERHLIFY